MSKCASVWVGICFIFNVLSSVQAEGYHLRDSANRRYYSQVYGADTRQNINESATSARYDSLAGLSGSVPIIVNDDQFPTTNSFIRRTPPAGIRSEGPAGNTPIGMSESVRTAHAGPSSVGYPAEAPTSGSLRPIVDAGALVIPVWPEEARDGFVLERRINDTGIQYTAFPTRAMRPVAHNPGLGRFDTIVHASYRRGIGR